MGARHRAKTVRRHVERDDRRPAAILDRRRARWWIRRRIASSSEAMPSGRSLPKPQTWRIENASAAAFMARSAWTTPSTLLVVTIARAPVRLSAIVSSACRHSSGSSGDHQSGAMRGQHRQHEFDGVRQLNRDDRIGRQSGLDEMRRQRGDGPVGLREGQALRRLPGDARLVGGIDQRRRIRLPRQRSAETIRRASAMRLVWVTAITSMQLGLHRLAAGLCHQVSGR